MFVPQNLPQDHGEETADELPDTSYNKEMFSPRSPTLCTLSERIWAIVGQPFLTTSSQSTHRKSTEEKHRQVFQKANTQQAECLRQEGGGTWDLQAFRTFE